MTTKNIPAVPAVFALVLLAVLAAAVAVEPAAFAGFFAGSFAAICDVFTTAYGIVRGVATSLA